MGSKFLISTEGIFDKLIIDTLIEIIDYQGQYSANLSKNIIVRKSGGISGVIRQIEGTDYHCIGIIDDDKRKPKSYSDYADCEISEKKEIENIIYRYKENGHFKYLIVFCPAPEKWLDKCAIEISSSRKDFGLPEFFDDYRDMTKRSEMTGEDRALLTNYIKKLDSQGSYTLMLLKRSLMRLVNYHLKDRTSE